MIHRDIMSPQKAILVLSLVVLVGIVFTLHILPKGIAWGFACVGIKLDSSDMGTKYGMGIAVRLFGMAVLLPILSQLSDMRIFAYRVDKTCFALSWLFFVWNCIVCGALELYFADIYFSKAEWYFGICYLCH